MATDAASILQSYLGFGSDLANSKLDQKKQQVQEASARKMEQLDPFVTGAGIVTGKGVESASPFEMDVRNLNPAQLMIRYGADAGNQISTDRRQGVEEYLAPAYAPDRTNAQLFGDTVNTVLAAPVQMIGGIGALGLGAVNDRAGTWTAKRLGDFTKAVQSIQSEQMRDARRGFGAEQALDERDSTKQYEQDVKESGSFLAGAKRIGRDTIATFGNAFRNPTMAADTIANAGGSLIGGGVISAGLRKIGAATVGRVVSPRVAALGSKASMPASIVGMEAGAAYQQTVDQVLQDLADRTDLTDEQKQQMANDAGLEAAAIQGGVTAVTAPLLGGAAFERAPFAVNSFSQAARRALGETIEEGFQEGSAQIASNKGIQDQVDPNQTLSEGVGQGVALGAIGGLGSSTVTQAPGVALQGALETAKLPVRALSKALTYAGDRVAKRNQAVQDDLIAQADTNAAISETEAAQVPVFRSFDGDVMSDVTEDDPDVQSTAQMFGIPKNRISNALRDGDFRAQVEMTKRMKTVANDKAPVPDRLEAATDLNGLNDDVIAAETLDKVEGLKGIKNTVNKAVQSDVVQAALKGAKKLYGTHGDTIVKAVNDGLSTVENLIKSKDTDPALIEAGWRRNNEGAQAIVGMAEYAPEKIDPAVVDKILYHADQGNITLNTQQRSTLRAAKAFVNAQQTASEEAANKYQLSNVDEVSREILTKKWEREEEVEANLRKKSLLEHMEGIRATYNAGDLQSATDLLSDLRLFGEHMSNKVGALNASFAAPGENGRHLPVAYDALVRPRSAQPFVKSNKPLTLIPYAEGSVAFAQQVALEASTVVAVLNNLIDAFPDLGVQHLTAPSLDASLDGEAASVAKQYRQRERKVPSRTDQPTGEAVERAAPEADQTGQVEPSSEIVEDVEPTPIQENSEQVETTEPVTEAVSSDPEPEAQTEVQAEVEPTQSAEPTETGPMSTLLGSSESNRAKAGFTVPDVKTTRTFGVESPIETVKEALRNETTFRQMIDGNLNRAYPASVATAYQEFLKLGDGLVQIMDKRLQAYLKSRADRNVSPEQALSFIEAQALNIVDAETGKYNPVLLQNAVLAGLQWYLKLNQYGSRMDEKDARQYLRLSPEDVLPEGLVDELNVGMTTAATVRSLAREVGRFWGLNENQNAPRNYAEGVKEGVAKEVLMAMIEGGLVQQIKIDISNVSTNENIDHVNHYEMATTGEGEKKTPLISPDHPIRQFPTAIEKAVLTEPEELNYIGAAPTKVARTQLRNQAVENTPEQVKAIKVQQQVRHYLNQPFIDMLTNMGEDLILRLFAGGDIDNTSLNVNHKRTLAGRNITVQSAFRTLVSLVEETKNVSSLNGTDLGETPIFYDYNDTVVNRQQMLGKDNPQSNKLMREAVLPTWATLDLTDPQMLQNFRMGLAQALGIKVHTQEIDTSIAQLSEKLAKYEQTFRILNDGSFDENAIDTMKAEGVDSVAGLHALMEYARYQNEATDKTKFRTSVYFEADGVTNGVVNAMALFSSGEFTGQQLEALARGGYHVGENARSLDQLRKEFPKNSADLYGLAGTKTTEKVRALRAAYMGVGDVTRQFNAVRDLLSEFFGGVSFDGQNIIVDRGATKNPLTITIYGSGESGIAGNIVDEVISKIYETMSLAAQRLDADKTLTPAQAFYGGDAETAQVKFDRLTETLQTLTSNTLVVERGKNNDGIFVIEAKQPKKQSPKAFTSFTFAPEQVRALRGNVHHAFVGPMVEGITETVGEDLMQSMNAIKTLVQSWSLIGKYAYQQAYQTVLENKRRENPKRSKNELLSPAEEERVFKSVWNFMPYFSTGSQNFLFGMKQSTDGNTEFARALNDELQSPAFGYAPDDAGVAGIPGLTIGAGDGQTVVNAVLDPRIGEMLSGFLQIFDGIHSSVADMNRMGQIANNAVFSAWQNNPLENLSSAFSKMVQRLDISKLSLTDEQRATMTKSLFPAEYWRTPMSDENLTKRLNQWANHGRIISERVATRHAVMKRVQSSVDQMAGASSPYLNEGLILSGSPQQKAAAMENLRKEVTQEDAQVTTPVRQVTPSLMGKALEKQINKITADPTMRALLREVTRSGRVDDYTIHMGTRQQLLDQAASIGISVSTDRSGFMGFAVPGAKAIFVVDGNPETMLHELIHAATFETIDAHYRGEDVGTAAQLAISNLEELMNQFKTTDLENDAQQNALDEMERQEAAESRAGELNEFMAWSLANADLQEALKASKASPAVRMARKVISAIKNLLWGGKRSAAVKDDMFSNIRFNTNILMRSPTVADSMSNGVLFHDPSFGTNPRIDALSEKIKNKITDYADTDVVTRTINRQKLNPALVNAARVSQAFQNAGFNMTMQEQIAFIRMIAIMGTDAQLDGNATERMQEMFTHVSKHLGIEDFMRNPEEDNPADTEQATLKFNVLMGKFATRKDAYDRSVVLPAFIALAATNNEFRQILSKMEMPKTKYARWNSVDNILDNVGDTAIDNLSRWVSGEGVLTKDVQSALDGLMDQMLQTSEEGRMFIEKFTNPIGNGIDRANDTVKDALDWMGRTALENARNVRTNNPNSKVKNLLAGSLATSLALLNEQNGHEAATQFMSGANQRKIWRPFYDLLKDMIGRTSENAGVYDLIKMARTWVNGMRQQFREQLPRILNAKFSRQLTEVEQTHLHQGLGQTGAASLLSINTVDLVLEMLGDQAARDVRMAQLEQRISQRANGNLVLAKSKQLADFMISKKNDRPNLLRNAEAIAHLLGETVRGTDTSIEQVQDIEQLVSLYALNNLDAPTQASLSSLVQSEAEGLKFMLSYLQGQDEIDKAKATGNARFNHFKGHMPSETAQGVSLIVASDENAAKLLEKSYTRLGAYEGSSKDPTTRYMAYYFAPVSGRAPFAQGVMQNVQQTVSGVDQLTGFSTNLTAGQITDPQLVQRLAARGRAGNQESGNTLMPVYDQNGNLYAFERSIDPAMLVHLNQNTDMAKMMGVRSGRQSEEASAHEINKVLVDRLRDMWDADRRSRSGEYVNLFQSNDPIHKDAVKIFSAETRDYINARFPEGFYVRKDMIDDAVGYRQASVGDAWTGNSRWSPQTQEHVKKILMGMWGNKAFARAVKAEQVLQNIIQDIRVAIVIKSVVVPMANAASNIYQLIGRGVPVADILRGVPKKTAEIESWHKSRIRQIEAEAELHATDDPIQKRRLEAEIQTIKDAHKRLTIWPLLEAGEFSSISDAGSRDDILLTEGKLSEYLEKAVSKLPKSVQTAGRYAIMSKDTALFRALQKSVEYGDFVAKAIVYDDLVKRQKKSKEFALGRVTEEFVNYDRLPGRDRAYLESIGLMWFWNFKIRSTKVALSMVRNNPVHSLIAASLPMPVSGIGLPLNDNLWSALFDGRLTNSVGYHMAFRAPGLLPIGNLLW